MYIETSSQLAREAEVTPALIRLYAALGLLDFVRASNGTRLFKSGQGPRVREILAKRMKHAGRRRA
jgi:DNA-binding transcriptional MerR regulator